MRSQPEGWMQVKGEKRRELQQENLTGGMAAGVGMLEKATPLAARQSA
jgi:hypothetical protein